MINNFLEFLLALIFANCYASYLSVIIYRLPRNQPIIGLKPLGIPPNCSNCQTPLRWYQYYPLPYWLLLRPACSNCGHRAPSIFFVSDLLLMVSSLTIWYCYGFGENYVLESLGIGIILIMLHIHQQKLAVTGALIITASMSLVIKKLYFGPELANIVIKIAAAMILLLLLASKTKIDKRQLQLIIIACYSYLWLATS